MSPRDAQHLALILRHRRQHLGLSANATARLAGIDPGTYVRIEGAKVPNPRPENLAAIARALQLAATDLFAIARWLPPHELPGFSAYLRDKYRGMPEAAIRELEDFMRDVSARYGCPKANTDTQMQL